MKNPMALIQKLSEDLVALRSQKSRAEQALEELNVKISMIEEVMLPAAMEQADMKECVTASGLRVKLGSKIYASAGSKREPERLKQTIAWLIDHGHADLVKHELIVPLGRDQEKVRLVEEMLTLEGVEFSEDLSVNASTLSAFCREKLAQGVELPACMKVYDKKICEVEVP